MACARAQGLRAGSPALPIWSIPLRHQLGVTLAGHSERERAWTERSEGASVRDEAHFPRRGK